MKRNLLEFAICGLCCVSLLGCTSVRRAEMNTAAQIAELEQKCEVVVLAEKATGEVRSRRYFFDVLPLFEPKSPKTDLEANFKVLSVYKGEFGAETLPLTIPLGTNPPPVFFYCLIGFDRSKVGDKPTDIRVLPLGTNRLDQIKEELKQQFGKGSS